MGDYRSISALPSTAEPKASRISIPAIARLIVSCFPRRPLRLHQARMPTRILTLPLSAHAGRRHTPLRSARPAQARPDPQNRARRRSDEAGRSSHTRLAPACRAHTTSCFAYVKGIIPGNSCRKDEFDRRYSDRVLCPISRPAKSLLDCFGVRAANRSFVCRPQLQSVWTRPR